MVRHGIEQGPALTRERRFAVLVGALGAGLFILCCALVRGGLFDSAPYGDVGYYARYAHEMGQGHWPYRDFFDEYPPLAQPLFLFVHALPGSYATAFKWTMALLGAAALALLVATLASIGASRRRLAIAAATAGLAPIVVGPIFLNAYDLWPAALVAAAVFAYARKWERAAYALLALAVAAKLYPLVLLPVALVETWRLGGRDATRRALAWFVGVLFLVHLPFLATGPGGLRFSYWVQLKRGLELESIGGAILLVLDRLGLHHVVVASRPPGSTNVVGGLADAMATLSSLAAVVAVLAVAWLYARRRGSPLVAAAAAVVAFLAFGKVFSPQYVDWLVPLVPAAGAVASALLLVVLGLTRIVFDRFHSPGGPSGEHYLDALTWWVFARDLLVFGLYAWLVARLRKPRSNSA